MSEIKDEREVEAIRCLDKAVLWFGVEGTREVLDDYNDDFEGLKDVGDEQMRRKLRCMTCSGFEFYLFARFYENGRTMNKTGGDEYVCVRCGEKMDIEWVEE